MSLLRVVLTVAAAAIAVGSLLAVILNATVEDDVGLTAVAQTTPAQTPAPDPAQTPPAAAVQQPVVPQQIYLQIDWAAARAAAARLQKNEQNSILRSAKRRAPMADRLTLPLLLPGDKKLNDNLKLYTTHDHQYSATSKQEGAIVELIGSRIAAVAPPQAAEELAPLRLSAERARGYRIERTEYGLDISFTRFGAAYNISVLCDDPYKDERCAKDDYAIGLVESANVVIPEPQAEPK